VTAAGRRQLLRWLAGIASTLVVLAALVVVAAALFDWNHARAWIGDRVKERTGRVLVIGGDLRVHPFSLRPRVHAEAVTLANAGWGDDTPMIVADTIDFSVSLPALLAGRVVFPEVALGKAAVLLQRDRDGRRNWVLDPDEERTGEPAEIERLTVNDGRLAVKDAVSDTVLEVTVQTVADETYGVAVTARGRARGYRLKAAGQGGRLLGLLDRSEPYPLKLEAAIGEASVAFDGTITGLAELRAVDGRFALSGRDLATLGDALRLAFPHTAPYKVAGRLTREADVWRYADFSGTVGRSDLAGTVSVNLGGERPVLEAALDSKLLDIADLGGFIGTRPGTPDRKRPGKVLPAEPISVEKLRRADARVTLKATKFRNRDKLPLDNLTARLDLKDGVMRFDPLVFGIAGGSANTRATVDARAARPVVDIDSRVRRLRLGQLVPGAKVVEESVGALDGRVQLKGAGRSLAAVLGSANGRVDLLSGGGEVSNLLLEFGGADFGEIIGFWVGGDRKVALRCAVMAFRAREGMLTAEALVVDTDDTYFGGRGAINLRDELLDIEVTPLPKDVSILSLRGPLAIRGSFADPEIGLEKKSLARKIGAALLLALVNPLAAIIPTIETGPGRDVKAPCGELVGQLQANVQGAPAKEKRGAAAPGRAPVRGPG
jgi:uncharacterized protein involved in outer membrane biogenesis